MAKGCVKDRADLLDMIYEKDPVAKELISKIDLNSIDNPNAIFYDAAESIHNYRLLQTYTRLKIATNPIDWYNFAVGMVDRISKFWYETQYKNFFDFIWKVWEYSDDDLRRLYPDVSLTSIKKSIEDTRKALSWNVVLEFEYLTNTEDTVWKLFESKEWFKKRAKWMERWEHADLFKDIESRFDAFVKTQKWKTPEAQYKKALENIFWWKIPSDNVVKTLINAWGTFKTFSNVMAYMYVTSWKASFTTAFKILESIWLESLKKVDKYSDTSFWFRSDYKELSTKQEKVDSIVKYLLEQKKERTKWSLDDVINAAFILDNQAIKSTNNIFSQNINYLNSIMQLRLSPDFDAVQYIKSLANDRSLTINLIEQLDVNDFFWVPANTIDEIAQFDKSALYKFWIDYKTVKDQWMLDIIEKYDISTPEQFVKYMKKDINQFIDRVSELTDNAIANADVKNQSIIASALRKQKYSTDIISNNKTLLLVKDDSWFDMHPQWSDNQKELTRLHYQSNYVPTTLNVKQITRSELQNYPKEWTIVFMEDTPRTKWKEDTKFLEWYAYFMPAYGLRFWADSWYLRVNATDKQSLDKYFSGLWENLYNQLRYVDNSKEYAKKITEINKLIRQEQNKNVSRVRDFLTSKNKTQDGIIARWAKFLSSINQRQVINTTRWEIVTQAKQILKDNKPKIAQYISSFFPSVENIDVKQITHRDVIWLMFWDNKKTIINIGQRLWIMEAPVFKVTDFDSFWKYSVWKISQKLNIELESEAIAFKKFMQFVWDNDNTIDILVNKSKEYAQKIDVFAKTDLAWRENVPELKMSVQDFIDWVKLWWEDEKNTLLAFVDIYMKWNTDISNRIWYAMFENAAWARTIPLWLDRRILELWNAMEEFASIARDAKWAWIRLVDDVYDTEKILDEVKVKSEVWAFPVYDIDWLKAERKTLSDEIVSKNKEKKILEMNLEKNNTPLARLWNEAEIDAKNLEIKARIQDIENYVLDVWDAIRSIDWQLRIVKSKKIDKTNYLTKPYQRDYTIKIGGKKVELKFTWMMSQKDVNKYDIYEWWNKIWYFEWSKTKEWELSIHDINIDKSKQWQWFWKWIIRWLIDAYGANWFILSTAIANTEAKRYRDYIQFKYNNFKDFDSIKVNMNWWVYNDIWNNDRLKNMFKWSKIDVSDWLLKWWIVFTDSPLNWYAKIYSKDDIRKIIDSEIILDSDTDIVRQKKINNINVWIRDYLLWIQEKYWTAFPIVTQSRQWSTNVFKAIYSNSTIPLELKWAELKKYLKSTLIDAVDDNLSVLDEAYKTRLEDLRKDDYYRVSFNRLIENWYTTVWTVEWAKKIDIETWIESLLKEVRWEDDIIPLLPKLDNIDYYKLPLDVKQKIFTYLQWIYVWKAFNNAKLWIEKIIASSIPWWSDIFNNFIDNYKLKSIYAWGIRSYLPFVAEKYITEAQDIMNHQKMLNNLNSRFWESMTRDEFDVRVSDAVDSIFWWDIWIKDMYLEYGKMYDDEMVRKIIAGKERINEIDSIADQYIDTLKRFNTIKDDIQKYNPVLTYKWRDVYDMRWSDLSAINNNTFLKEQNVKERYTIEETTKMLNDAVDEWIERISSQWWIWCI